MNVTKLLSILLLFSALLLKSCNVPPEKAAYQVEVSAGAFIQSLQKQHPECATQTAGVCEYLPRAISAQHALADAIDVYCAGPTYNQGGACNAPGKGAPGYEQAIDKLNVAVAAYEQIEADLKAVIKGAK